MPAGDLADKFSKQQVIKWTLVAEVLGMGYGVFAMVVNSVPNIYAALFVVALQASIFNPAKYAILPEIAKEGEISKVNGIMTLSTYLAIIAGTFLASFFTQITGSNYTFVALFCLGVAFLALYSSLQIEKTPVKNPTKKVNPLFLAQVYKSLKLASKYPHLLLAVLASSYFLFTASYTQLNMIPFGLQSLHITDVQAGYVFLAAALGIGIGSMVVAFVSGKSVELGLAIFGAFGTSFSYIILYLFSQNIWVAVFMILSLGIHGGLYIVPLDAYIQIASPEKERGEIVASGTFLGFIGVLLAATCVGFFSKILNLTAAEGYFIVGLLSIGVSISIMFLLPDYFTRFVAISFFKGFYHITPQNQPKLGFYDTALIISKKYSFPSILCLLQLYPRIAFIRIVKKAPSIFVRPIYRLLHIVPYPISDLSAETPLFLQKIYDKKMPICLFLEGSLKFESDQNYEQIVGHILEQNTKPTIPLYLEESRPSGSHSLFHNLFKAFTVHTQAHFGSITEEKLSYSKALEKTQEIEKH